MMKPSNHPFMLTVKLIDEYYGKVDLKHQIIQEYIKALEELHAKNLVMLTNRKTGLLTGATREAMAGQNDAINLQLKKLLGR